MPASVDVSPIVERALERRAALLARADTTALRLVHGHADGVPGLVVERFADVLVAQLHDGVLALAEEHVRSLCAALLERTGARPVYRKVFVKDRSRGRPDMDALHRDPQPWIGERAEPQITVLENGTKFLVRPYDGFSVGLFLEQRENRRRVRDLAAQWRREQGSPLRVLNGFSYTCGFSVAAGLGGGATVSVDVSKRHLEWGKLNFAANGIDVQPPPAPPPAGPPRSGSLGTPQPRSAASPAHMFILSDVGDYYPRAERQQRQFDLVILDPPTFARAGKGGRPFVLKRDLPALLSGAVRLLAPGGRVLVSTNDRTLPLKRLEQELKSAGAGRRARIVGQPELPADFAGDPDFSKSMIAEFR